MKMKNTVKIQTHKTEDQKPKIKHQAENLVKTKRVLVAGSGSGGLGVLLAIDHIAARLTDMGFKVAQPPFHPFTLSPFHPRHCNPFTLSPFHPFTLSP